jgi:hypothetical protein
MKVIEETVKSTYEKIESYQHQIKELEALILQREKEKAEFLKKLT